MTKVEEFLQIPTIRIYKDVVYFNGLEFSGDINPYSLGFINGAWFIFNGEHNENN